MNAVITKAKIDSALCSLLDLAKGWDGPITWCDGTSFCTDGARMAGANAGEICAEKG